MALSAEDRKRLSVDSLIGYCQSAFAIVDADKAGRKRWADSLIEMADVLAKKHDESK